MLVFVIGGSIGVSSRRRLLILGPSFKRKRDAGLLPALERYDGIFFRIARRYLSNVKDVDVLVMADDLTLVDGNTPLAYHAPKGNMWSKQEFSVEIIEKAKAKNEVFLYNKLKNRTYSEVFLAMGKQYANALPNLEQINVKVIFPTHGGLGPKAQALKRWLLGK